MTTITKKLLLFLVLTALSYLLNTVSISMYYGVHFLLGSIPLVMMLKKLGVWPAFIGAIIAQSYTLFLWNHPYALIIFSLEILFIGLFFKKKVANLILRDALYWLIIGVPLVFLFYGQALHFGLDGTIMVALKDTMNGLVNVWVAEFLLFISSVIYRMWRKEVSTFYKMREVVSYMSSGVLLVLSFTLVMQIGYYEQSQGRSQLFITTQDKIDEVTRYYESWTDDKLNEHQFWLNQLQSSAQSRSELQSEVDDLRIDPSTAQIRINSETSLDQQQMSYSFTDEAVYFLVRDPIVLDAGQSVVVETAFPMDRVSEYVLSPLTDEEMNITVLSSEGSVILSNLRGVPEEAIQSRNSWTTLGAFDGGDVIVDEPNLPSMQQWKQSVYTIQNAIPNSNATLIVETGFMPFVDYQLMNLSLFIILIVVIITLIIGEILSGRLMKRFETLSRTTNEIVAALPHMKERTEFPSSMIYELETLSNNFQVMMKEWQEKYKTSQDANEELQEKKKQLEKSQQQMEYMAHYDTLTNLPNRRQFNKAMDELIAKKRKKFGLLFIDVDRFKDINDQYGHEIGDQVLIKVGEKLREELVCGEAYRLSGDEFTVIAEDLENTDLDLVCRHVLALFDEPIELEETNIQICLSIGKAIFPDEAQSKNELIRIADHAMYESKKAGRNQMS
ncbi:GGDEF domain-containing protein [Halobacillus litoralis]|uniref:GGDEF domain-containing protein n=1 Tax=Halobacillus litoralis TaxID=45668 RepID=UPI001CD606A3|nr:GGDEF domain-containing protein [Halobacillus litoralis]MCA0971727.1 GGDEF domain-containing protein [Halobacillus litoralis]